MSRCGYFDLTPVLLCPCPANTKHLYNIYTMLVQHCINVIQMFCVCWVAEFKYLELFCVGNMCLHNYIDNAIILF